MKTESVESFMWSRVGVTVVATLLLIAGTLRGAGVTVHPGALSFTQPVAALLSCRSNILLAVEVLLMLLIVAPAEQKHGSLTVGVIGVLSGVIGWMIYGMLPIDAPEASGMSPFIAGVAALFLMGNCRPLFTRPGQVPAAVVFAVALVLLLASPLTLSIGYVRTAIAVLVGLGVGFGLYIGLRVLTSDEEDKDEPVVPGGHGPARSATPVTTSQYLTEQLGLGTVSRTSSGELTFSGDPKAIETGLWQAFSTEAEGAPKEQPLPHEVRRIFYEQLQFFRFTGNHESLSRMVEQVRSSWPETPVPEYALDIMTRNAIRVQEVDKAETYLNLLMKTYPQSASIEALAPELVWAFIMLKRHTPATKWLDMYQRMNPPSDAVAWLKQALAVGRTRMMMQMNGTVINVTSLIAQGKFKEAFDHVEQANSEESIQADMMVVLFDGLAKFGHVNEALKVGMWMLKQHANEPETAYVLYNGGDLLIQVKKEDKLARQWWSKLVEKFPASPWAQQARRKLQQLADASRPQI